MNLLPRILLALASLLLCAAPSAAEYVPQEAHKIVAIGDLHGDYQAYLEIVEAAGLSDADAHWLGGKTIMVQMGDVPDRGPGTLDIIHHLMKLEKAAAKAGGQVVALVGNHEEMNMTGDLRYTTPAEFAAFADKNSEARRLHIYDLNHGEITGFYRAKDPKISEAEVLDDWIKATPLGKVEHDFAWSPRGEIGKWVIGHQAIAKINGVLFVHGGISVETAAHPIQEINAQVRKELIKPPRKGYSILTDEFGPLWYRGNVRREPQPAATGDAATPPPEPPRPSIEEELAIVLKAYDARRLVVAHTPDLNGIEAVDGGRLIRVDTGITSYYGGPHSYLVIEGDKTVAYNEDKQGNWISRELQAPDGDSQ
jgi:hypothetical protein